MTMSNNGNGNLVSAELDANIVASILKACVNGSTIRAYVKSPPLR
ncbi:MAG TPA: hypothetical protein VIP70_02190 [Nitrososphaeraceae archaeon]